MVRMQGKTSNGNFAHAYQLFLQARMLAYHLRTSLFGK